MPDRDDRAQSFARFQETIRRVYEEVLRERRSLSADLAGLQVTAESMRAYRSAPPLDCPEDPRRRRH